MSLHGDRELGVWSIGEPRDPRTWSSTPASLIAAMERQGTSVRALSGYDPGPIDRIYSASAILRGPGARRFRHYWGADHKRLAERWSRYRGANPDLPVLHTDIAWLDPATVGPNDYLFRDCAWEWWARHRGFQGNLERRLSQRYSDVISRMGGVFATSKWAAGELVREGARASSTFTVGTGVGTVATTGSGNRLYGNRRVLCVAKVRHHDKGVDLLLEAFRILQERHDNAQLTLVSPATPRHTPSNVEVVSNLSASTLRDLFETADLYAMPARAEPYGLVYIEALLAGTPILGSPRAAFPEFAGQGQRGFIVESLRPTIIADNLQSALSDPDRLRVMGSYGRDFASRYTWDDVARRILTAMQDDSP